MRASRLVSIVLALQNAGKLTARQLSEQLEVSERTILRDMEELSAAGIPVYAERGKEGGWLLAEGYRTTLTGIHADELAALLVASRSELLSDLGHDRQLEAALQKLLAAATDAARSGAEAVRRKLHIDGAGWQPNSRRSEPVSCLAAVQEAVWQERVLRIVYLRDGLEKIRLVYPLGLVAKRGIWYLVADTEGDGLRTFRISRLVRTESLPEVFEPPQDFDLASYWENSLEQFRERLPRYPAKLKVRADAMPKLDRERYVTVHSRSHDSAQQINDEPVSQWLLVEVEFETPESAVEIVLGFGGRMEVLETPELRRLVRDEIRSASMVYL
ncbi:helix-turn-helix transcriptional regulator [Paenibacillus sp. strain BS8-2]